MSLKVQSAQEASLRRLPRFSGWGFGIIRVMLGLFLLATAGLKVQGLTVEPLSQNPFLPSPRLQIASIEFEAILGYGC